MNRLQKKAWFELVGAMVCMVFVGVVLAGFVSNNIRGIGYVIITVVVALIAALAGFIWTKKSEAGFDERERMILQKSFRWSTYVFTMFLLSVCFSIFFIVGGRGVVPVWSLPAVFMVGLFVAQFTQTACILLLLAMESEDE